jgi:hypothetical protein
VSIRLIRKSRPGATVSASLPDSCACDNRDSSLGTDRSARAWSTSSGRLVTSHGVNVAEMMSAVAVTSPPQAAQLLGPPWISAETGKTEALKNLAKALMIFCCVRP